MLKNKFYLIWIIVIMILAAGLIKFSRADTVDHLVISEVQVAGIDSGDEFIEFYNPTPSAINISSWSIQYKGATGSTFYKKNFSSNNIISAHCFFLVARGLNGSNQDGYRGTILADMAHRTFSLGDTGGNVFLVNNQTLLTSSTSTAIVDKVAYGSGDSPETAATSLPLASNSIERQPGSDQGNGQDTDNNSADFFVQTTPNPQNTGSSPEPAISGPVCGNGSCETGENHSNCPQDCFCGNGICDADKGESSTTCPADCSVQQSPVCGNNLKETGEDCDGVDLSGQTCISQGFTGGALSCNSSCAFDLSGCTNNNNGGSEIYVPHQVQPGDILINEIFSEPDATKGESEWIEFYNHTDDAALDLTGWTLEDNTAKPVILAGIILAPRQYYALDKSKFSFALNNGGDTLILKNNQVIIDQVAYGDYEDGNAGENAPASGLSKSIGRRTSEPIDTNNDKNDFSICQSVTPGRVNDAGTDVETTDSSQPTAVSSANAPVIISEFLPNPSGSDNNEWIELYNSGLSAVDLTGWQADDGEGGSSPYALPSNTTIPVDGYLILPWSQTKIVLNNNFDAVRLIRPDKTIQEQINYKDPPEGASYARDSSGSWEYTSTLTPGSANIFNVDDTGADGAVDKTILTDDLSGASGGANGDLVEVDDLPQLDDGQAATIQGLVVAPPNLFAKSYFYLNGAQIYSFAAKFPDLQIGDLIEVKGIVSASFSNRRLKIKSADDIQVLGHQNLSPRSVAISELDDGLIGHFLRISGQLVDKTGNKLYLDDNQEEVEVYLSPAIKWNKNLFTEGQNLQVSGILAEVKEGWRLLPRCDNDLIISAATIDNSLSDNQNQAQVENKNDPSAATLASSAATVWQNLNRPAAIKYLFLSAGVIIIFLAGVFLKLRGII